jgi:hypothetical protein
MNNCPDIRLDKPLPGMSVMDNTSMTKLNAALRDSWADTYLHHVLPEIPVERLFPLYSDRWGRPCKNIRTMYGLSTSRRCRI